MRTHPRDDRGSLAVELSIIMPLLLLLLALVYAYGRMAQANGTIEAGARDGARAASQARSLDEAKAAAEAAVEDSLGPGAPCTLADQTLRVNVRDNRFEPGYPVTIKASCVYPLGDLGLPGVPGTVTLTSSFTSPVDPNRGVR